MGTWGITMRQSDYGLDMLGFAEKALRLNEYAIPYY